jgi:sugar (pentulose or hexulose) kinase
VTNRYYIGIDCGTSGTKTVLICDSGEIVSKAYCGYPLIKPGKYMVEQDANRWWEAVVQTVLSCCQGIDKKKVKAMAVSAQAGCAVPVKNGAPLDNALSWLDARAHEVTQRYFGLLGNDTVYGKTGWPVSAGMTFPKIIWYKENKPSIFEAADKFLSTVDYINFKLTGEYVIDPSNAALTQCYNLVDNDWDQDILGLIDFDKEKLPEILDSGKLIGKLTSQAAKELNLSEDTLVYSGGHDQYCVAAGAGVFTPGEMLIATGTAWVNLAASDRPVFDTENHLTPGRHVRENTWGLLTSVPAAGASMEWFNDNFGQRASEEKEDSKESFGKIDSVCSERMTQDSGVMFYPGQTRVSGKRGAFIGLGLEHDRYDLFLAIMEAAAFEVRIKVQAFEKVIGGIRYPIMTGGAAKSNLWRTICASVLDREIYAVREPDMAAIGAALVAAFGYGEFEDLTKSVKRIKIERIHVSPDPNYVKRYREKYGKHLEFRRFCLE